MDRLCLRLLLVSVYVQKDEPELVLACHVEHLLISTIHFITFAPPLVI